MSASPPPGVPPSGPVPARPSWPRRLWREWILGAVLPIWLVITFGFTFARVDGDSMNPTLHTGDIALLLKYPRWLRVWNLWEGYPRRGDIVVFRAPASSPYAYQNSVFPDGLFGVRPRPYNIKRVIGLPGDTVGVSGGRVRVNGRPVEEPYTAVSTDRDEPAVTLGANEIYVLGDNRLVGESVDSRYYGPVNLSDVAGPANWHLSLSRPGT
ncbi:signal peptidase I [Deinococcus altitudinis]|uniref:signal peptidase I n=1 Tax=Deinococcus altitudinis TaxID=468914 RepID=UPI00389159E0